MRAHLNAALENLDEAPPIQPGPAACNETVDFLEQLRPGGPWVLSAIVPDGTIETIAALSPSAVRAFVERYNGKRNLYFGVNPTREVLARKAAKTEIAKIEYVLADLDPAEGESSVDAKARYRAHLETFEPRPTFVIDSGNGIQLLWRLAVSIVLGEPGPGADGTLCYSPTEQAKIDEAETRSAALMAQLNAKAGTQNIDRILRLPGTINLPNAKKKREGRVVCPTKLIDFQDVSHSLDSFPLPSDVVGLNKTKERNGPVADVTLEDLEHLTGVDIAELSISKEIKEAIDSDGSETGGGDRSKGAARVVCELVRARPTSARRGVPASSRSPLWGSSCRRAHSSNRHREFFRSHPLRRSRAPSIYHLTGW
jgi:hypothetical protein